jgi:cbb3-type cytochrome oxidase subunit 3
LETTWEYRKKKKGKKEKEKAGTLPFEQRPLH